MNVLSVLGLIFITLKLCGVITWSWIWVLLPFWFTFAILLFMLLVMIGAYCVERIVSK